MPIDYSKYPANWKTEIRPRILKRDNNKCKFCGLLNGLYIFRDAQGRPYEAEMVLNAMDEFGYDYFCHELSNCAYRNRPAFRVVLTIAHLDHDIENNEDDNLAALCQQCHLRHDAPYKAAKKKAEKARKNPMLPGIY